MGMAPLVSVHGGHSGEFCSHARDRLEDILAAYRDQGFLWVGITEHMPAARPELVPDDERAAGLSAADTQARFGAYFRTARELQQRLSGKLDVLVGFEAEIYSDSSEFLAGLIREHRPDYVVGSVHHVHDLIIDASPEVYREAAARSGGLDGLYCDYFDLQHTLLEAIAPAVVGHFDLIRMFDPDYRERLVRPEIWMRIERNLRLVREQRSLLDFNVRALSKGASEPYVSAPILARAKELGVPLAPGDDSHGVADVGRHLDRAIALLERLGFDTSWQRPAC
jgi:histidinol-phosphatase (PHP family)